MNRSIARFNRRITIQKNTPTTDEHLNHFNTWADYYTCWAYASTYRYDKEKQGEAVIIPEQSINFEVRYSPETKNLTSDGYRILFNGSVYDIISVDMMNYQNQTVIIRTMIGKAVKS
jgi:SPP1 family predicted phage head-tail adaptor